MTVTTNSAAVAVATLYADHQPALLIYLQRLVGDHATAEDLCQESFIKALQGWERRDATHNAVAWLYQIARNTAYDALRHRRRIGFSSLADHELLAADEPTLDRRVSDQEMVRLALA
jgi:RNA polymerase sigma factor (sigma-70 family)